LNQLEFKGRHHILLLCFLTYLFIGTGFYSDDFIEFVTQYNLGISSISEFFYIDTENHHVAIFNVFSSYFHRIWLLLFGDNYIYYFIPKVIVSYVAVVLLVKFFSQYCSPYNAAFISFIPFTRCN